MYTTTKGISVLFTHAPAGIPKAHWLFEVTVGADELDETGFVIDPKELEERVLQPTHALLDRAFATSEALFDCSETKWTSTEFGGAIGTYHGGHKVAVFNFTPSAERLAEWFYKTATRQFAHIPRIRILEARISENINPTQAVAVYNGASVSEQVF